MSILSVLGQTYSLNAFAKLIFSILGSTSIVILGVSFVGLIAYVASIAKTRSIVGLDPKLSGIQFFSNLGYIFFIPVFIWLLFYQTGQFFLLLSYLVIPVISIWMQRKFLGEGWNYQDFIKTSSGAKIIELFSSIEKWHFDPTLKKILSSIIQALALIGEIYLFAYFSPTFSLVIWLFFVYFFTMFTVDATLNLTQMLSVRTCDYNKFTLKNGSIEGFVVSRDQDHYHLMTENGTLSIFTSNILQMSHLTPSELDEWKKKNLKQR